MTEHYSGHDPELGCGYLMLAGLVGLLATVALLILAARSPAALIVILILAVAMIGGAAGAIWFNRRISK